MFLKNRKFPVQSWIAAVKAKMLGVSTVYLKNYGLNKIKQQLRWLKPFDIGVIGVIVTSEWAPGQQFDGVGLAQPRLQGLYQGGHAV